MNLRYTQGCHLLQEWTKRKLLSLSHLCGKKIQVKQVTHTHCGAVEVSLELMRCFVKY